MNPPPKIKPTPSPFSLSPLSTDPFSNNFPEKLADHVLQAGRITTCAFNRWGTLLATGCQDGATAIWDWETQGIVKWLRGGHTKPIATLAWSRDGRRVSSASQEGTVVVWDIEHDEYLEMKQAKEKSENGENNNNNNNDDDDDEKKKKLKIATIDVSFGEPKIWAESIQFHPSNTDILVVSIKSSPPLLINVNGKIDRILQKVADDEKKAGRTAIPAIFSFDGSEIYVGYPTAVVSIFSTATLEPLQSHTLGTGNVKSMILSPTGAQLLINSTDKMLRLVDLPSFELIHSFRDVVNNRQLMKAGFNGSGEYVVAGATDRSDNIIFIWNQETKQLCKTLDGVNEGMVDFAWHPRAPQIVSIAAKGSLMVWEKVIGENWSAYAPNFKELEENEEYIEREDEFDIIPEEEKERKKQLAEDEFIDILNVPPTLRLDIEKHELPYLPATPESWYDLPPTSTIVKITNNTPDEENEEIRILKYERVNKKTNSNEGGGGEAKRAKVQN